MRPGLPHAAAGHPCKSRKSRKTIALLLLASRSVHVVAHVVVLCSSCPMTCHNSGADRCGADRGRSCAADLGRHAARATGARCRISPGSRSWTCQCHRSWRKSWRSSATLVQASGDSSGWTCTNGAERGCATDPRKQNVEVNQGDSAGAVSASAFFFSFDSVWEAELWACTPKSVCCPTSPPPHARFDSERKRWNLEHVVLDLFSHSVG